ncbi:MAG: TonB-dependent receptor plug domain-containing protein [Bernardetiaceae bacterium]
MTRYKNIVLCCWLYLFSYLVYGQDTLTIQTAFDSEITDVLFLKGKVSTTTQARNVTTVSRSTEKADKAPATLYVITQEQIARRQYTSLEEVLADIPEIEIQGLANTEFGSVYTLRGISGNDKFLILQNGVRMSPATSSPHVIGHNYMVQHAQQIEVLLGPASALYGADAFVGVVNIITDNDFKGLRATTSYGRFQTTDNSLVLGLTNNKLSLLAFGKYYFSEQANLPDFYPEDFAWYNEQFRPTGDVRGSLFDPDARANVGYQPFAMPLEAYQTGLQLTYGDFELSLSLSQESHATATSDKPEFTPYFADNRYITNLGIINAAYQYQAGRYYSRTSLGLNNFWIGNQSVYQNVYSAYERAYKYANETTIQLEQLVSVELSDRSSLTAGVLFQKFVALPKTNDLPRPFMPNDYYELTYIGTDLFDANNRTLAIPQDFYWLQYFNLGGFAQYKTSLSPALNLTAGLRYDYNSRFAGSLNPRLGLVYSPSSRLTMKALYGRSFLAASPYTAYQHFGSFVPTQDEAGNYTGFQSFFMHLPNPDLMPERNRSIELAGKYNFSQRVTLFANAYYNRWTDIITDTYQENLSFQGYPVFTAEIADNVGEADIFGGTLGLQAAHRIGDAEIEHQAAYTHSQGTLDGSPIPLSAQHTLKYLGELSYQRFSLVLRFLYRSPSLHKIVTDQEGNRVSNPAFAVLSGVLNYRWLKKSLVFLKVNNLTDRRYYHVSSAGVTSLAVNPQMPITWQIGLNYVLER